jgi:hypothetical protein
MQLTCRQYKALRHIEFMSKKIETVIVHKRSRFSGDKNYTYISGHSLVTLKSLEKKGYIEINCECDRSACIDGESGHMIICTYTAKLIKNKG